MITNEHDFNKATQRTVNKVYRALSEGTALKLTPDEVQVVAFHFNLVAEALGQNSQSSTEEPAQGATSPNPATD